MHPALLDSMREELYKIAAAELKKQAFVTGAVNFAVKGARGAKRAKSIASTTVGRSSLITALPKIQNPTAKRNIVKGIVDAGKARKPLRPEDLSDVVIDGVRVPKSALEGGIPGFLQDAAIKAPKALGKAEDAALVAASTPAAQRLLSMDASSAAINLADGVGGALLEVGGTAALPSLVGKAGKAARKASKVKGLKPGRLVPSSAIPAVPRY